MSHSVPHRRPHFTLRALTARLSRWATLVFVPLRFVTPSDYVLDRSCHHGPPKRRPHSTRSRSSVAERSSTSEPLLLLPLPSLPYSSPITVGSLLRHPISLPSLTTPPLASPLVTVVPPITRSPLASLTPVVVRSHPLVLVTSFTLSHSLSMLSHSHLVIMAFVSRMSRSTPTTSCYSRPCFLAHSFTNRTWLLGTPYATSHGRAVLVTPVRSFVSATSVEVQAPETTSAPNVTRYCCVPLFVPRRLPPLLRLLLRHVASS